MMGGVIDLHAHLLHGLDDGAATLDDSVAMVRMAAHAGTREIVATIHASRTWPYNPKLAQRRWEDLQYLVRDVMRIHRACEVELTPEMISQVLANPARYTINGTQYLLAEAPDDAEPEQVEALLRQLLENGLRPVLVHPELHPPISRQTGRLARWVRAGVLLQVGAGSVSGGFGSRAEAVATRLIKRGLVHFVASGGHNLQGRPPRLDAVRLHLLGQYPPEFVHLLLEEHPRAVLRGGEIAPGPLRAPFLKAHWLQFWH
jgi:protein-tyrosine phosphatase